MGESRAAAARHASVLVVRWDESEAAEAELRTYLRELPATIAVVAAERGSTALALISDREIIACVLLVSRTAIAHETFPLVVNACVEQLGRRREFRLFVHLANLTRAQLLEAAQTRPAVANLADSVHIGESSEHEQMQVLADSIKDHFRKLPEILDYLRFVRYKRLLVPLAPLSSALFVILMAVAFWQLAAHKEETLASHWFPWVIAIIGAIFYSTFLAICSLGSNLRTGTLFRWATVLYPLWIISNVPSPKIIANWPFLLAGFGVGFLLDSNRRLFSQYRREQIPITTTAPGTESTRTPGGRYWQMLTTAPIFGVDANVFVSYSRASRWGSEVASSLHQALEEAGVPSFLDVEKIVEATSWRHKVQRAIAASSVFVSIQDSLTVNRHWPTAELNAAIQSQAYCGQPTIIVLRNETLSDDLIENEGAPLLRTLFRQTGEIDPLLLRVVDFKADTPRHIARGLIQWESVSVINPGLAFIFRNLLRPVRTMLARLGVVGAGVAIMACLVLAGFYLGGHRPEMWLRAHSLSIPGLMIAAFWCGFVPRIAIASRFELLSADAPGVFRAQLLGVLAAVLLVSVLVPGQSALTIVFACLSLGLGFLVACDFIDLGLPGSDKYREPPI